VDGDRPIVVALTGQFGAGCTTVAEYLRREGQFRSYKFSAIIEEAARRRLGHDVYNRLQPVERRRVLQDEGNTLREEDPAAIAKAILGQIEVDGAAAGDVVVETIRNPAEVSAFRDAYAGRCFVVSLDAPVETRFKRKQTEYGDNLEQFKKDDARDKGEGEPEYGQRTDQCVYLADISINNHEHLDSRTGWNLFFTKIASYLSLMRQPAFRRPTYEELYMRQAYALSLISSCTKRQVGAIIVSETAGHGAPPEGDVGSRGSYVIAAGFNDVPVGDLECKERGPQDDPRFCPKDDEEERKLRAMRYCPQCGVELLLPEGKVRGFRCPNCDARLPRDFVPGRMLDTCRAVHAEEGAILQAAKLGSTALRGATLYTTTFPCPLCGRSIINAGIKKVVYNEPYPADATVDILQRCGVALEKYEGVNAWAFDRMFRGMLD